MARTGGAGEEAGGVFQIRQMRPGRRPSSTIDQAPRPERCKVAGWESATAHTMGSVLVVVGTASAQTSKPTAHVDTDDVAIGQQVLVQGGGWPAGSLVHLKLCGNEAADLSADCDLTSEGEAGVGTDGSFSMTMPITRPPTPCPCPRQP